MDYKREPFTLKKYTEKKSGVTFLEIAITVAILAILGNLTFFSWKRTLNNNAAEADKLKIVLAINNSNIDSLNENINRKIAFNTDDPNLSLKKGIYVYRTSVNGSTPGFERDPGSSYTGSILSPTPVENVAFECNKSNSPVKLCPVFIFNSTPEDKIDYPNSSLVLDTATASKGRIYSIDSKGVKNALSFVSYTFDAENYPRNRIFFNSFYSTLQIYVYKYKGKKDSTAPLRTNIKTYHTNRMSQYFPDSDPDWEREQYYVIPLKVEL